MPQKTLDTLPFLCKGGVAMKKHTRRNHRTRADRKELWPVLGILSITLLGFFPALVAIGAGTPVESIGGEGGTPNGPLDATAPIMTAPVTTPVTATPVSDTPTSVDDTEVSTTPVPTPSVVLRNNTPTVLGATTDASDETLTTLPATGAFPFLLFVTGIAALTAGGAFGIAAHRRSAHAPRSKKR